MTPFAYQGFGFGEVRGFIFLLGLLGRGMRGIAKMGGAHIVAASALLLGRRYEIPALARRRLASCLYIYIYISSSSKPIYNSTSPSLDLLFSQVYIKTKRSRKLAM